MSKATLAKMLKMCYRNGFFNLQNLKNYDTAIQYGPLGTLLRRNLLREWLISVINNSEVNMFPIEVMQSENHLRQSSNKSSTISFLPEAFRNYFKVLPHIEKDSPCGFAAYGPCSNKAFLKSEKLHESVLLLKKLESKFGLCIVFFCPGKRSTDWFNYWARYRYRWWRKFSSTPSTFSMSDGAESETGDQQVSLTMEFPWGKGEIEKITLFDENFFLNSCQNFALRCKGPTSAIVVCESELNLSAFAHLSNSFAEKFRQGEIRKLFQLHSKLAPYKVSIFVTSDCLNELKVLRDVAKHLEKDLKKYQIPVFPNIDLSVKDKSSYFSRCDEMGIPYTIVLDKIALNSGIAHLRNRDTTLHEQVHITELTSKLLKYLQMKSFVLDDL